MNYTKCLHHINQRLQNRPAMNSTQRRLRKRLAKNKVIDAMALEMMREGLEGIQMENEDRASRACQVRKDADGHYYMPQFENGKEIGGILYVP